MSKKGLMTHGCILFFPSWSAENFIWPHFSFSGWSIKFQGKGHVSLTFHPPISQMGALMWKITVKIIFSSKFVQSKLSSPTVCFLNLFVTSFGQNWVRASLKFFEALFSFPGHKSRLWKSKSQSGSQLLQLLKSTLLDFKSGKSDNNSTPPQRSDPLPKP